MKKILTTSIAFAKRRLWLSLGIVLVIILAGWFFFRSGPVAAENVIVRRGTISEQVTVTGKTKPVDDLQLAFQSGGRVARVKVAVGDAVSAGEILAELDTSELSAQLAQARANIQVQEAKLSELRRGSRPEDLQITQTELKNAEQGLANAYANVFNVLNDAYTKADDAVRKQLDELFVNDDDSTPQLTFQPADSFVKNDAEQKRAAATVALRAWKKDLADLQKISVTPGIIVPALDADLTKANGYLLVVRDLLNSAMDAIAGQSNLSPANASTYKTNITTARTNVGTALVSVTSQEQTISSQEIAISRIQDQLALKLAGTPAEQVTGQEAFLRQAEAQAQVLVAQIGKSIIRSPINGLVTKQDAKLGEIASPNAPLISVISEGKLGIEANVTEADVAKIRIGNPAQITFDAFGETVKFSGRVSFIDPAETVIDGVPTYKTTFQLDDGNPAIKPGLTANLDILANQHENALVIPQRVIQYDGDKRFVFIYRPNNELPEKRDVTTGLRGFDGNIEVLSGLTEGERVLPSVK